MAATLPSIIAVISASILLGSGCAGDPEAAADNRSAATVNKQQTSAPRVEGQLMLRFKDSVSAERALEILNREQAQILTRYSDTRLFHIALPETLTVEQGIGQFSSYSEVEFVEPNQVYTIQDRQE